ncbi:MAG TPA: YfhO family protein, partial [Ferruginibacter sp.]|nr:YfhO family protein [Ferruginibacter sp.]
NAAGYQFAVFSQVYYPLGWKVLIDGKETPYCRVNYALRGLAIPAGKHTIDFIFDPESVRTGETVARYANILSVLIVLLCIAMIWRNGKKKDSDKSNAA